MANDKREISEIVKKCKILLLDVEGTTTSISFVKDKLFPYAAENVKQFLDSKWESEDVKEVVIALRKLALEDQENSIDGVVAIPGEDATKEDQIEGLVNNVKWQMSSDRKVGALKQLQGLIWKQGYDNGDIKGHVYDDVLPALEQWHAVDGQKVYIYSSGSVQAQKLLFGQSLAGDLLKYIDGHFDTAVGAKQEAASYKAIVEKIGCNTEDILFLTDVVKEAEAARQSGLHVALVSREGNAPLSDEAIASYPVLQSLGQLTVSNKRKTDPQDEQPAKVPKTNVSGDVKAEPLSEVKPVVAAESKVEPEKTSAQLDKMEVDESAGEAAEAKVETVIEEVTDSKDVDAPVCDIEPIVTEANVEKSEETQDDKMDTEIVKESSETVKSKVDEVSADNSESKPEKEPMETADGPEVKKDSGPAAEETPPTVITEIEEITNEKEALSDVADIIDDLEPVVEEPPTAADMEELQNVGEELEKECNEILSKVQDVTNLDNINVKPLLNPIIEDPMEVDSEATNGDKISSTPSEDLNGEATKDVENGLTKHDGKCETKESIETCPVKENSISDSKPQEKSINNDKVDASVEKNDEKVSEKPVNEVENTKENDQSADAAKANDKPNDVEKQSETNNADKKTDSKDSIVEEVQLNGEAKNGKTEEVKQNGVENKQDDVSARLTAENGKTVNGSNGSTKDSEQDQGDSKVDEIPEIKVKTLPADEPRPDPIEQATEA